MAALLLLADSQLLFRQATKIELSQRIQKRLQSSVGGRITAAYIGAANNNESEYFELARDAFSALVPTLESMVFIRNEQELPQYPCQLVVLAGGNVTRGWDFLHRDKVRSWLDSCYGLSNCVIVGVSAGAIHLAAGCDPDQDQADQKIQTYLGWLKRVVAVHEENREWPTLQLAKLQRPQWPRMGIAMAGGIWVDEGQLAKLGFGAVLMSPS